MNGTCTQSVLWTSGTEGYDTYRIPAIIVTTPGTILAFCEGRRESRSDTGDIDMLVKRSEDGGRTWSEQEVVWGDAGNTCGNPCPVVDGETGTVWLLMTHNLGIDHEPRIIDGTSRGSRTVWVTASGDDGRTWHEPRDVTATAKQADWTWYATGPGNGIQLSSGRLLIPCDHIEADTRRYYSHVVYSDDHGETWRLGGSTSRDQVNECCVAELEDGDVLLNTRNYDRSRRTRQVTVSGDGGMTWRDQRHDDTLIEPICQAALVRLPGDGDRLLFSNPASRDERRNLTVRLSDGAGGSWPHHKVLHPGPAAYSSLAVLQDGTVACLYERGDDHPYETITLARFDLEWLADAPEVARGLKGR